MMILQIPKNCQSSKLLCLCILFCLTTLSQAGDIKEYKAFAKSKGCFDCHGLSGNTGDEDKESPVPKLAGQPKSYLIKAMKDYRSGARKNDDMFTLMAPRSDDEIEILAEYYSAQKRY
jgi:cytochrome c553